MTEPRLKFEVSTAIAFGAVTLAVTALLLDYHSPYNQCVRAQTEINESGKTVIYTFPQSLAKIQCAEALGGKPD